VPTGLDLRVIANSRFQPVPVWKRAKACYGQLTIGDTKKPDVMPHCIMLSGRADDFAI
jgi:hypothetical protein